MNTPTKEQVIDLLRAFVKQRPGLDYREYGSRESYMGDYRSILQAKNDAEILLSSVEHSQITAEEILSACKSAFAGRLSIVPTKNDGEFRIDYCTGQYWPTEYRRAVCAVLASALWVYHREDVTGENLGDQIRAKFRRIFGKGIQSRWFN